MSRFRVCDGELPVTQNGRPAGSRSACQPRPGPTSARRVPEPADLGATSSVPRSKWARTAPSRLVEALEQQLERRPGSSCHLPANSRAGDGPAPGQQRTPERHLPVVAATGESMLTWTSRCGDRRATPPARAVGFARPEHAERQATGGGQGAPAVVLGDELCAQFPGPGAVASGSALEVDVHPRRPVDPLHVDVRRPSRRLEAAQLGVSGPRLPRRPTQRTRPELRLSPVPSCGDVDHCVQRGPVGQRTAGSTSRP